MVALFAAATLALASQSGAAIAQSAKSLTFVQMHPVIGVGEEVFSTQYRSSWATSGMKAIDVQIQGAPSGTVAAQVLQTGGAQLGTTAPESIMQMREQGGDVVAVFGLKRNAGTFVVVMDNSSIQSLADLKGKQVAANSFGSGGGFSLKQSLNEIWRSTRAVYASHDAAGSLARSLLSIRKNRRAGTVGRDVEARRGIPASSCERLTSHFRTASREWQLPPMGLW